MPLGSYNSFKRNTEKIEIPKRWMRLITTIVNIFSANSSMKNHQKFSEFTQTLKTKMDENYFSSRVDFFEKFKQRNFELLIFIQMINEQTIQNLSLLKRVNFYSFL